MSQQKKSLSPRAIREYSVEVLVGLILLVITVSVFSMTVGESLGFPVNPALEMSMSLVLAIVVAVLILAVTLTPILLFLFVLISLFRIRSDGNQGESAEG